MISLRQLILSCAAASGAAALSPTALASGISWFDSLSAAKRAAIYWKADTETGNVSQWDPNAPWSSGDSSWAIVTAPAPVHSGSYAIRSTINTSKGQSGVRWPLRQVPTTPNILPDAYYSAWVYLPSAFDAEWFMLMQWKTGKNDGGSDPVKSVNLVLNDGVVRAALYDFVGNDGRYNTPGNGMRQVAAVAFPTAQWVHLEAFYDWSTKPTGSVIVYQDGVEILRQTNTITQYDYQTADPFGLQQWAVNNYGDRLQPNPYTLYFDDAAVSQFRLSGPEPPAELRGDFNRNGRVDAADYTVWRNTRGQAVAVGAGADGNLNGLVDDADYQLWKANVGRSSGGGSGASLVPEPATIGLLVILAMLAAFSFLVRGGRRHFTA